MNKSRIVSASQWAHEQELDEERDALAFVLSVDDADASHSHDNIGHAFPVSRWQLVELARQIQQALTETEAG